MKNKSYLHKPYYIHYGTRKFDKNFNYNTGKYIHMREYESCFAKPVGFWASHSQSDYDWKHYCLDNDIFLNSFKYSFKFTLKPDTKILTVRSLYDVKDYIRHVYDPIHHRDYRDEYMLNFDKIYKEYDAMEVFHDNYTEIHYSSIFNSWDCDSICIWNLSKIKPIK